MTVTVHCAWCGKALERDPGLVEKNKQKLFFCNRKEAGQYYKEHKSYIGKPQQRGFRKRGPALS